MEEEQTFENIGRSIESVLDEIGEEEMPFDEYCEGIEKHVQTWGKQAERIIRFHVKLVEETHESPTPIDLLKALANYEGYRDKLLTYTEDPTVVRYFEEKHPKARGFLTQAIARALALLLSERFYRTGVMTNVENPQLDEEREEEKERYLEFKKVSDRMEKHPSVK